MDEENHNNFNKRPAGDSHYHTSGSVDPRNSPYETGCLISGFIFVVLTQGLDFSRGRVEEPDKMA